MNHEITVTAGVLLEVTCSCGVRLLDVRSAPLALIANVAADHLDRVLPPLDWSALVDGEYIHGLCDAPHCIWCNNFSDRESCD